LSDVAGAYAVSVTEVTDAEVTIDELARRTGMTVRNIRAHQSRGLLPSPRVRGRIGYYGPDHLARIELIKEMQADGFNLGAIARLLEGYAGGGAELLRFTRKVKEPFEDELPQVLDVSDLVDRWGEADAAMLSRAQSLGLIRDLGRGKFEELSPRLGRVGAELVALGVPLASALDVVERVKRHADGIAREFVKLFIDEVWRPFEDAGAPPARWPDVQEALERLRPLAAEAVLGIFQQAMSARVDREFSRTVERMGRRQRSATSRSRSSASPAG
jgi:DNA-binding transcriptional MerR regulator